MSGQGEAGALAGLRVVDLTRVLGGPYGTQILGDHGADVIKVEPPQGDETRDWGPPFHDGDASYFIGVNRNKRSLGLDLSVPAGREVLFRLLERADVLIENFKPGAMERWGLGYDDVLGARFPRLIHCRISGFGADGPLGGLPGYDAVVQAMAGMFSINGDGEGGPTRIGIPLVDLGTGLYSVIAILMALVERDRSGRGQYLDMTLFDCGVALMHPDAANFFLSGDVPRATGNAHPNLNPYDGYRTATGDVFIAAGNDRAFARLCAGIGRPELAGDPRFAGNSDRLANRDALKAEIEDATGRIDAETLCARLMGAGVPAGPVLDTRQVVEHAHTAHRAMLARAGAYRGTGTPIKLSRTPGAVRAAPPGFGRDGREILAEHGYAPEEIERLAADGVLVERRRKQAAG